MNSLSKPNHINTGLYPLPNIIKSIPGFGAVYILSTLYGKLFVLCFLHFFYYVLDRSSLIDSHYVLQFAQKSIRDVFYKLQLSFSRRLVAELSLLFYHVHSANKKKIDKASFSTENE